METTHTPRVAPSARPSGQTIKSTNPATGEIIGTVPKLGAAETRAAIETARAHGKEPEVWPSSGGTMPAFAFDEYLKLPWVASGLGHGSRAHAPNEYASVDGMKRFMAGEASLVYAAAKRGRREGPIARGKAPVAGLKSRPNSGPKSGRFAWRKSTHSQREIFSATPINSVI